MDFDESPELLLLLLTLVEACCTSSSKNAYLALHSSRDGMGFEFCSILDTCRRTGFGGDGDGCGAGCDAFCGGGKGAGGAGVGFLEALGGRLGWG